MKRSRQTLKVPRSRSVEIEMSVVIPCLNESETIGACIDKAHEGLGSLGVPYEIIVADNGSTDGSIQIAVAKKARVVNVAEKGYGNALMYGIAEARGKYVIMGDADDSYDFREIPKFYAKLVEGFPLVQGCRLPKGGGRVMPGAMPWLHRVFGNPFLSFLARLMFPNPVHDIYCGMRGFSKEHYERLGLRCTGMEFATEMIIKTALHRVKVAEVPITLHKDGRKNARSHLRTFRDGWRTLRFFLVSSPRWLFLYPAALFILAGLAGYAIAIPGLTIGRATFDVNTLLVASMLLHLGYDCFLFAVVAKTYAIKQKIFPMSDTAATFFRVFRLERGLLLGAATFFVGTTIIGYVVYEWSRVGFGPLDYPRTMRLVIPAVTLCMLGFQTILSSFLVSIVGMDRK